jgi:DNA modification methylase
LTTTTATTTDETKTLPVNQFVCGDALQVLRTLPDNSLDMVLTSPPYWSLRNYQTVPVIWPTTTDSQDGCCTHDFVSRSYKLHNGRGDAQKSGKYSEQAPIPDRPMMDATCRRCGAWRGELGLKPTFQMYINHLMTIFEEVKRVLKPTGSC